MIPFHCSKFGKLLVCCCRMDRRVKAGSTRAMMNRYLLQLFTCLSPLLLVLHYCASHARTLQFRILVTSRSSVLAMQVLCAWFHELLGATVDASNLQQVFCCLPAARMPHSHRVPLNLSSHDRAAGEWPTLFARDSGSEWCIISFGV